MLLPGRNVILIAVILVLTSCIVANAGKDDNTININLGFDLVHSENGVPALRVQDFEDIRPRTVDDDDSGDPLAKNRSDSDEKEKDDEDNKSAKPAKESNSDSDGDNDDSDDATTVVDRITRGLIMDEKELEPKGRGSKKDDSDDDDE